MHMVLHKEISGVAEKSTILGFQQSVSVPFFCHDVMGAFDFISISEYVKYMNDKLLDLFSAIILLLGLTLFEYVMKNINSDL